MKKMLLLLLCSFIVTATYAQSADAPKKDAPKNEEADSLLPYQKYPTLPAFNILGLDSATIFNTFNIPEGHPVVLMLFSPDCEHCQRLTEKLLKGMDSLKDVRFYMFTPMKLHHLQKFYDKYHLGNYKNIMFVGKDYEFFFYGYYGAKFVPYLAVYDKHKKLLKGYPDGVTVKELYDITH